MTQPTFSKRLAGRPAVTVALFVFYGLLLLGWLNGGVSWWLAFIAAIAALRTFRAYREMRTYKAWLASWQEMGADGTAAPVAKKRTGRALMIIAVLLALVLPVAFHGSPPPPGVLWLWAFTLLFLVGKVLYQFGRVGRRIVGGPARQGAKTGTAEEDAPVTWLLPRASSSPSRADAERHLPDYSARLLLTERQHGVARYIALKGCKTP